MKPIDVQESINKNKLVFHKNLFDKIISIFGKVFIVLCILFTSFFIFLGEIKNNNLLIASIILFFGITLIIVFLFILKSNKDLKLIKGKSKHNNIYRIKNFIKKKNYSVLRKEQNYIKIEIHNMFSGFHWGRNMYIVFNDDNILINASTIDPFGFIIPFHFFGNRKIENKFLKEFKLYEK